MIGWVPNGPARRVSPDGSTWLPMCGSPRVTHKMGSHVRGSVGKSICPTSDRGKKIECFKYNYPTLTNTEAFCDKTPHLRIVQVVKWGQYRCCWSGPSARRPENFHMVSEPGGGPVLPRDWISDFGLIATSFPSFSAFLSTA